MQKVIRACRASAVILSACFVAALVAMRGGLIDVRPGALAAIAGGVLVAAACASAVAVVRAVRAPGHRLPRGAEAALFLGLAVTAGAGLVNWALGIQGVVVLTEGEAVPLARGAHLQEFSAGPLARLDDLGGVVRLAKVDLRPAGGGFAPESVLDVTPDGGQVRQVRVTLSRGAPLGAVALHQGAFGFAPRVVLQKDGATVLDRTVPFSSRRDAARGVAFEGDLDLPERGLTIAAAVDLEDLDPEMRGHPALLVEVRRGGERLGRGRLLPGHGATMRDGWHVGYGGMKMWAEIDVRRPASRTPTLLGLALVVAGAGAWAVVALSARRRFR